MYKTKILAKPKKVSQISFEELYESIAMDWEKKAEELRIRRWQQLKQKLV